MSPFAWLRSLFTNAGTADHNYIESSRVFPELDTGRLRDRMKLVQEGARRGRSNLPSAEQDVLDTVETAIIATIQSEAGRAHSRLLANLSAYDERLAALGIAARLSELLAAAHAARSGFQTQITFGRDLLFQLKAEVIAIAGELQRFQEAHQLERLPRYPSSRVWHVGIIALLVVVEASLNGFLLARGSELGLLGGVFQALIIAVFNVGLGLFVGAVVARSVVHRRWWRRAIGISGLVAFAVVIPAFNLAVAHYRAAYAGPSPESAERDALTSFLSAPFHITEVTGWLLFFMGVAFSVIAGVDGWNLDDPYPGYGWLARRRDQLFSDYVAQKEELTAQLAATRDHAVAQLTLTSRDLDMRISQQAETQARKAALLSLFSQHLSHIEQSGNELLASYRQANVESRSTPPPPHFGVAWHLSKNAYGLPTTDVSSAEVRLRDRFNEVTDQVVTVRSEIDSDYQVAIREYEAMSELVPVTER